MRTIDVLNKHKKVEASTWREDAEYRRNNSHWLKYSALIALMVKQRMSVIGVTQVMLADKLGCSQQHVSMLLKGKTNLTLETIAKLEVALDFDIIGEALLSVDGYCQGCSVERRAYLSDGDSAPYGSEE